MTYRSAADHDDRSWQEVYDEPGTKIVGLAADIDRQPRRGRATAVRTMSGSHNAKGEFIIRYDSGWKEAA